MVTKSRSKAKTNVYKKQKDTIADSLGVGWEQHTFAVQRCGSGRLSCSRPRMGSPEAA